MDGVEAVSGRSTAVYCRDATADHQNNNNHNSELTTFENDDEKRRLAKDGFSSPMPSTSEEIDEKKGWFASARGSAILATLTKGISKLSGPRWFQKVLLHARREQLL
jgi:hypothetical protein